MLVLQTVVQDADVDRVRRLDDVVVLLPTDAVRVVQPRVLDLTPAVDAQDVAGTVGVDPQQAEAGPSDERDTAARRVLP
ncbi:hypothetical protein [Dactylosporangium cerinum]